MAAKESNRGARNAKESVIEENEKESIEYDYNTTLLEKELELKPALFLKSGKRSKSKIKEINELTDRLFKVATTKIKDVPPCSPKPKKIKKRKLTVSETAVTSKKVCNHV